ncbi:MAG: hypothetical protein Q8R15_05075 [Candidatus Micrarchaeota archaeon]|nr:hypothetical protein [Candidatus Micrarchaeota archaeon]
MAEYRIESEVIKIKEKPTNGHRMRLLKDGRQIASVDFDHNYINYIEGRIDREFVRTHHTSPAAELIMHVAHHNRYTDGTALLHFVGLRPDAQAAVNRLEKKGIVQTKTRDGPFVRCVIMKKIETKIPPVPMD